MRASHLESGEELARTAANRAVLKGVAHGTLWGVVLRGSALLMRGGQGPGHVLLQRPLLHHLGGHET